MLDPHRRNPVTRVDASPGVARTLLDRAAARRELDEPSQDFIALDQARSHLCFAVTDGVGSSFLGEFAACFLAQHVVDWLLALPAAPEGIELAEQLDAHLRALQPEAAELVDAHDVRSELPPMMREVVERQRAYGSEAMFVCGRIDWPGHGAERAAVAWLGDGVLRVCRRDGREDLRGRTADRWSTRRGPRGEIAARAWPVHEVERIIAGSDGVLGELDAILVLSDATLDARLAALAADEESDDMALVDIALVAAAMPPVHGGPAAPARPTALPNEVRVGPAAPEWLPSSGPLAWREVPGAEGYSVQMAHTADFVDAVEYRVERAPFAAPALEWARLRTHADGCAGPWGAPRRLGAGRLQAPTGLTVDAVGRGLEVRWDGVPGAEGYVLRVAAPDGREHEQRVRETRVRMSLPAGDYRISVCAASGAWSHPTTVRVVEERWR